MLLRVSEHDDLALSGQYVTIDYDLSTRATRVY